MTNKQKIDEPRNMVIRRATAFDVVNLAKMFTKANGERLQKGWDPKIPEGPVGEFAAVHFILALINLGLVFTADLEGRLMGAIGNSVHQYPWSDEWVLLNEWFYVLPHFREAEIGEVLVEATNIWADAEIEPRSGKKKAQLGVVFKTFPDLTGLSRPKLEELEYVFDNGSFKRAPLKTREAAATTPADPPQDDAAAA